MKPGADAHAAQPGWYFIFSAWVVAAGAMLASLFFSEVADVPVCSLCWYQRVALYPLVLLLPLGLFPFDPRIRRYALGLVTAGWLLAAYHLLLVAGVVPERMQPCVQGVPCSETHVLLLGVFNIPTLSFLTFTLIGALLLLAPGSRTP